MSERESGAGRRPKLLDEVRQAIRARQFSPRTEDAYVAWVRRFVLFHGKQHPERLGEAAVTAFLTHLAATQRLSAASQNQAASALLFLYREVLKQPMDPPKGVIRPLRPRRLPIVLTRGEVRAVLREMRGTQRLIAHLLYGTGLRLMEVLELRVKDVLMERREIVVRSGKGGHDRVAILPATLRRDLDRQLTLVGEQHAKDVAHGAGWVTLPTALERSATPSRRTCWRMVTTSAPSRSCSATAT